jgi:hypothetical protein
MSHPLGAITVIREFKAIKAFHPALSGFWYLTYVSIPDDAIE